MTESNAGSRGAIQCAALFAEPKRKPVKSLNGIEVDLLVSPHEFEGDTVLEGEVPDSALVIVKKGSLTIHGFVSGNVVAEQGVTIDGNVSGGIIISPRGQIKAQNALANSQLLAMASSVEISAAENPACVFGWTGITVAGDTHGGRFVGGQISIGGTATGSELHSTGAITVGALEVPPRGQTLVCLRNEISCEEFGRPMGQDERRLRRSIGKFVYARGIMHRLVRYAERDIQDSYLTFLYLLLSTRLDPQKMSVMRGIQAQANFLSEISAICELLIQTLSEIWKTPQASQEEFEPLADYCINSLTTIAEDTVTMANAFRLNNRPYIVGCCDEITKLVQAIKRQAITKPLALSAVTKLRDRKRGCDEMRAELLNGSEEYVSSMGLDPNVARSVEAQPHKAEAMVQKVREQLEKDPQNPRYPRLRSPLARLLQNTVDRSRKNIGSWQGTLREAELQLKDVRERLGANSTALFASNDPGATYLQAGRIAAGVTLAGASKNGLAPLESAASQIVISAPINAPSRFVLHGLDIQRRNAES